jgi:isocitrate dehydrogenase kinase/phosphatase
MGSAGTLSADGARRIADAFVHYNAEFRDITRRAVSHFDARDWVAREHDSVARIELYEQWVHGTVKQMATLLQDRLTERGIWTEIRERFSQRVAGLPDAAFMRTFFSSVVRRSLGTVGVDAETEFAVDALDPLEGIGSSAETVRYAHRGGLEWLAEDLLGDIRLRSSWIDFEKSSRYLAQQLAPVGTIQRIDILQPLFCQSTRAYVVGKITLADGNARPLAIALQNSQRGLLIDAVMTDEDEVSILFGFTRSYFHVDLERVVEAVVFLRELLPKKPLSELFAVLGRIKQGKTERYRELMLHLARSEDQFEHAAGERGLVMVCFTLPSLDVVFKLIRDRFPPVKNVVRQDVLDKYRFVFRHDRAGRLVDAQEFKRVRLPRSRFSDTLLEELATETRETVHMEGDDLIFDHMYIERRMTPLNLYVREAPANLADLAVIDYGQAIRDLACSNIFAGDLLLKNFGVTRHGRVIFYDYDELCPVTDCRFRDLPQATNDEDEMRGEAWFHVNDNDVFPETFINFLAFSDQQKAAFLRAHGDLLTADFWRALKKRLKAGEILEVLPYRRKLTQS